MNKALLQITPLLQNVVLVDEPSGEGNPTASVVACWISETTDQDHLFMLVKSGFLLLRGMPHL
jgi:hypothetical protein